MFNVNTGINPFWFIGEVADNNDPANYNRVRVRVIGLHPPEPNDEESDKMEKDSIATEDLHWAILINGTYGKMEFIPDVGDWVFGFFADGRDAQHPYVLGLLSGVGTNAGASLPLCPPGTTSVLSGGVSGIPVTNAVDGPPGQVSRYDTDLDDIPLGVSDMTTRSTTLPSQDKIDAIYAAADSAGIPRNLYLRLVNQETSFNDKFWTGGETSSAGAIGPAQLMPGTASDLGVNPYDMNQNLLGGARYLSQQYSAFGSWDLALAAYNAGPNNVLKYDGIPPFNETQKYVSSILGYNR